MFTFVKSFTDSAREFKNLKSVITAALLVAVHTVMAIFLSITVTDSLRISVSFLANVVTGALFGPIVGMVCGGIGDIVQFVIKPTGPYFPGLTLSAMLAGLVYGIAFYNRFPKRKQSSLQNDTAENATEVQLAGRIRKSEAEILGKTQSVVCKVLSLLLLAVGVAVWFIMPFAEAVDSKTKEVVVSGTALHVVKNAVQSHNAATVAIIMIIVCVAAVVLTIFNRHTIPLVVVTLGCFASGLAMYTDRKIITVLSGYWIITAVMVVYVLLQLYLLARLNELDLGFIIRCTIAMTIVNCLINGLLGTYWVSMLYGKGFAFYFTSRMIKNLVQLPINIVLTYYLLGFVGTIKKKGML